MSLYKKMHDVMCETEAIEKKVDVGWGKNAYKAVGEKEVLNMMKPLFKKYGLIMFPIEMNPVDRVDNFHTKDGESSRLMTQVSPKFKLVDIETGEFEIIASIGNGVDTQDKASGKALTYSLKVALQKTFMLFSGEDTDTTFSDDITEQQTKPISDNKPMTNIDKKVDEMLKLAAMKKQDIGKIKMSIVHKYNKTDLSTLTELEIEPIMKWLKGL